MQLNPMSLAIAAVQRAYAFAGTPTSPRGLVERARDLVGLDDEGTAALQRAVSGKVVLVTGASSGIGRASAVRFGRGGATVLLVARSEELLDEVAAEIRAEGGVAHIHPCNLTDFDQIDALVTKVLDQYGRVDILVNNAGMSIRRKVQHSQERFHDFERPMHLNYFAAIRLAMGLLPTMLEQEHGQIINISSWAALLRPGRFSGYSASKAALEAWSDAVQGEVAGDGVVFTNIHMPLVRTPMIVPTKSYRMMPALSMEQAARVVTDAAVTRARRLTPMVGTTIWLSEAMTPVLGDIARKYAI